MRMLRIFWDAARALREAAPDEATTMRYRTPDELRDLWTEAGAADVRTAFLSVDAVYADFDDFWEPLTLGVGPAGAYCRSLGEDERAALRDQVFARLGGPTGSFSLPARACAVVGTA
jgi:hypothetical protein